ncbi:hypothetical protein DMH04_02515 [Kibdelosporangium aridum]|uniref:MMPL family transporter n=1 Tax=Kibdelosporangium aridum TaxID=2030 RepID=A0A428ZUV1_KIBAR|nr:hypothetical protein [Kibdelosporangium aridum]RSM91856.1 hypothetical protein DMH04_02515 [Kibdelosporangium aridum]
MATPVDTARPIPPPAPGSPVKIRRLRWLLPASLVIGWLVIGAIGSGYQGKLSDVVEDSSAAFLPKSAEATEVDALVARSDDSTDVPALVVFARAEGLTGADKDFISTRAAALGQFQRQDLDKFGGMARPDLSGHPIPGRQGGAGRGGSAG